MKKNVQRKNSIGKRPFLLKFLIFLLILMPVVSGAMFYHSNPFHPLDMKGDSLRELLLSVSYYDWPFYFLPFLIGFGLYKIQKWAWYFLMAFSMYGTGYFSIRVIAVPSLENIPMLLQAMFFMMAIAYFSQFEIRTPYLNRKGFRGWREEYRIPVNLPILANDHAAKCLDLSPHGCALKWENHKLKRSERVKVQFKLEKVRYTMMGTVVRAAKDSVGISFENKKATQKSLKNHLMRIS